MPTFPSVFPLWRIALTAIIAAGVGFVVLHWRFKSMTISEATLGALVVGLSVLAWRLSANVPQFNDDPIALLSPNDWLCPMITYVCLGLYAALRPPTEPAHWPQARALLTAVVFVVNVLVI
jgi:hypothetical protein